VDKDPKTKKEVMYAAVRLFNSRGFDGTSVREIAKKADVNPALISYYFGGKKGLLESLIISYFEGYIDVLQECCQDAKHKTAKDILLNIVAATITYQFEHRHQARFVMRELTIDSVLTREVMATYLAKENYYFTTVLELGMKRKQFRRLVIPFVILKIKGLLMMPYMQPQYAVEVLHVNVYEDYFTKKYIEEINRWIEADLCVNSYTTRDIQKTAVK
jgi:TetR/AcrR family transcriptional regulator, biofilm operon repressor